MYNLVVQLQQNLVDFYLETFKFAFPCSTDSFNFSPNWFFNNYQVDKNAFLVSNKVLGCSSV